LDCELRDQVALVTGGGRGLGRAFAIALAQRGMRVAVASRGVEELSISVELLRANGIEALAVPTDVTNEVAVRNMVSKTESTLGPIDLLINSAGTGAPFGPAWETDSNEW
jgi:NAD(P)-dependent dehydrogenase (short-subunit alcohol dehydrogenase family)